MTQQSPTPPSTLNRNYREFSRMSASALVVMYASGLWRTLRSFGAVFLFILIKPGDAFERKQRFFVVMALIMLLGSFISPLMRFFATRFKIADGKLIIRHSWVSKKQTVIPLQHIHAIRTRSGFWYSLVDMVGISFDTIVSAEAEIELVLSEPELELLMATLYEEGGYEIRLERSGLMERQSVVAEATPQPAATLPSFTVKYTWIDLVRGACTQNPFKAFGLILLALVTVAQEISDYYIFLKSYLEGVGDNLSTVASQLAISWLFIPIALLAVYIVAVLIFTSYSFVKWYGLTLSIVGGVLHYSAGLITNKSTQLYRDRIVGFTFAQNILERLAKVHRVQIEQSVMAQGEKSKERLFFYGWRYYDTLMQWWLGPENASHPPVPSRSGLGLFYFRLFIHLLVAIPATIAAYLTGGGWVALAVGGPLMVYAISTSWVTMRRSGIGIDAQHVWIHRGQWATQLSLIPIDRIEGVCLQQSWFQRHSHRAHLLLSTKAGSYKVRSLPLADVEALRDYLLFRVEA